MPKVEWNGHELTDDLIVNINDAQYEDDKPLSYRGKAWLILVSCGWSAYPRAIVFASDEQEALDIAVDNDRLDSERVSPEDYAKMTQEEQEECLYLGNASEPFHQTDIRVREMPLPKRSWIAEFRESI